MENINKRKLELNNKIYPLFYGLTSDLIFWIAINTLFLTTIKNYSAFEINSMEAIATGVAIVIQLFAIKIIRKIGRLNSVKLGTIMQLMAAIILTISNTYVLTLVGQILYASSPTFKQMDNVILIKNLNYLKKSDDYIKIATKGSTIYALLTMIIALLSGFLFNINCYIPMIICISICTINVLLSNFIYEVPVDSKEEKKTTNKIKFTKIVFLLVLLYGAFYSIVSVSQENSKIFMQYNMENFLNTEKIAIYLSTIIFISRVVRLISDSVFMKVYNKLKNKIIYLFETLLVLSFLLLLIGNYIGKEMIGICIMAIGFCMYLALRDPFENYIRKTIFDNSEQEFHDKVIGYLWLSRKIFTLIFNGVVALILFKWSYVYVMSLFLIIAVSYLYVINKINRLLKK